MTTSTLVTPTPVSPVAENLKQNAPAFAGKYGYRALGAYSSGLGSEGTTTEPTTAYDPQVSPPPNTVLNQQLAQAREIWDSTKSSLRTGNPMPVINAVQDAGINDISRVEDKLGLSSVRPLSTPLRADHTIVNAVAKPVSAVATAAKNTVICTELMRRGDATPDDLAIEYRFVSKIPRFVVRGYRVWAVPYVGLMRKSPWLYTLTRPLAKAFMQESAALLGLQQHSFVGAVIIACGIPVCAVIGALSLPILTPCEV